MNYTLAFISFLTGIILFLFIHSIITINIYRNLPNTYIYLLNTILSSSLVFAILGIITYISGMESKLNLKPLGTLILYLLIIALQGIIFSKKYYLLTLSFLAGIVFYLVDRNHFLYLTMSFATLINIIFLVNDIITSNDQVTNNRFFFNYKVFLIFLIALFGNNLSLALQQNSTELYYVSFLLSSLSAFYPKLNYTFVLKENLTNENKKFSQLYHTFVEEMLVAKEIIDRLLPTKKDVKHLEFDKYFRPAIIVGGDFFDIIELSETKHIVYVSDISGHGIPAGIISAMLKTLVLKNIVSSDINLEHLTKRLNNDFNSILRETARYSTMFLALVDKKKKEIKYVSCGHTDVLYWDSNSNEFFYISSTAPILGLLDKIDVQSSFIGFNEGDFLIIPTDGLISITNKDGNTLGYEGFVNILKNYLSKDTKPNELVFNVSREIEKFSEDGSIFDDVTMLVIKL